MPNDNSAQPCGCDPAAQWICAWHSEKGQYEPPAHAIKGAIYGYATLKPELQARGALPSDASARKNMPIATGVLDYFPLAIAEIAKVSKAGNDQHNPGEPLHWAREKSTDHADCITRHLIERGTLDSDGQRHSAKLAWRALALLQTELEQAK